MSNRSPSAVYPSSLSDEQGAELDSLCASGNFEMLCCDTSPNVNILEQQYSSNSESPFHLECLSKTSNFTRIKPKTNSPEPEILRALDVEDLIQSHIAVDDESNPCDGFNSIYNHNGNNTAEKIKPSNSKIQSTSTIFNSPSKSSDESEKDSKKSKSNSSSFHIGQILNRKKVNKVIKMPSPDESNVDNLVINTRPFVFKKLNPSNSDENIQPTQVKTKLQTIWNNMKYGWRVRREVNLKLDSATWILGQCYHNKSSDGSVLQDVSKQLKLDLLSKIWLTYRINFPIIPGTEFMSDSGWGCMLRCGQMMMAQALVCHFLQRDWRVSFDQAPEKKQLHKMILRWFGDSLSNHSPFSLHHLVSLGENYGRKAGDWYGPTHAAQVLRDALIQAKRDHPLLRNICMYVALNGIVFKQDVMDLCLESSVQNSFNSGLKDEQQTPTTDSLYFLKPLIIEQKHSVQPISSLNIDACRGYDQESIHYDDAEFSCSDPCPSYSEFQPPSFNTVEPIWRSLILFVSVRLGNDKINPFYIPCLKSLLAYEHCIGIIGGRPKHALYFIGWQDDKLIHMDPHSCQPAIDVEKDDFNEKSFHSSAIRTMTFSDMDPSCAIGFYFRKKEEFDHFVEKFPEITAPMKKNLDYPVFALVEGKQVDIEKADTPYGYVRSSLSHTNSKTDEDDYILL